VERKPHQTRRGNDRIYTAFNTSIPTGMKKKYITIGQGEKCPTCETIMDRREHDVLRQKQLNAPYYFQWWDVCYECGRVQHYEQAKVHNRNRAATEYRRNRALFDELEAQNNHMRNL
jgi:hypothetical protein